MKRTCGTLVWGLALLAAVTVWAEPLVINHLNTDITALTQAQIERAKSMLHIAYGHTSHGSQLTDGMGGLVGFANGGGKGLALPENIFDWNNGGTDGALDLHDYALCNDVGYYPDWVVCTSNYLNDPENADVNVIIWSWCGQMDDKYAAGTLTNEYLAPMAAFEQNYPGVVFVYMTGHAPDPGEMNPDIDTRTKEACQCIRDYCTANNKVLFDFNDIEHYNPDGTFFEFVSDSCNYYATNSGTAAGNWATEWQAAHTENVDWYDCYAAHSVALNGNQKAYAAWALWCALGRDLDRDGLADEWEERHGGTGLFAGGTNDYDGDGITDWAEYVQDSSPTNSNAQFAIEATVGGGSAGAAFPSSTGRIYSLESSVGLTGGEWSAVTSQPGTGTTMSLVDGDPATGLNAYRVQVAVPD